MKFLLAAVNAKYIHSNPAIYSLRAYAGEKLGQYVEPAEYTINQSMQKILEDIYGRRPNVIGFSCYIWNWRLIQELLAELPKILPDAKLWLGGPEVTYDADVILKRYPQLSGIMVGEGEATFRELVEYYVGSGLGGIRKELSDIPGLCLPEGYTSCRAPADLDNIPFLYHDLEPFENKIIYYETSRGCPFRCSYCLSSIEKGVRFRDINIVKKELQFFLDHRVKQVKFVDRTFNCDRRHAMTVWQYILEHDNSVTNFHFEISADILGEEEIALLNRFRPGLAQLEIGVQSVNPETLKAIKRTMELEKLERAVAAVRRGGNVHLHLDLIAGLPCEDFESFRKSFNRVYRMEPEQLQLGFLKVLKGSEMWERAEEYGISYLDHPPYEVLCTKWLSYEEILRLKHIEEMVELYYNSGQFTHTMPFLEKAFSDPFTMYGALADFYGEKKDTLFSQARSQRYTMLLAFAEKYDNTRQTVYRELLTYDMYLRENLKSRPVFASELADCKESIRNFYKKEEKERVFLPNYEEYDWKQLSKMTHLEPFHYPVWDIKLMHDVYEKWENRNGDLPGNDRKCSEIRAFVLFDYKSRSPIDHGAKVTIVEPGSISRTSGIEFF